MVPENSTMDLDKLTIPPELFYPKINKADQLKRKYLSAAPTIKETTPRIRKKVLRKKRNEGPRLGRINHDFLRAVKAKKKLVKKTLRKEAKQEKKFARIYLNNSENTAPNNLSTSQVSLTSPNNVEQRLSTSLIKPSLIKVAPSVAQKTYEKQIKRQEKEQRQMLFVEEDFEPNRMSGGSFKFFKTKNSRPDASTDDDVGELNSSFEAVPVQETEANDFEDDMEPEFNTDKVNIESLLEQLDGEDSNGLSQNNEQPTPQTLDSVIDILQSVGIQQLSSPILNGVERVPIKSSKFMGMGTRQLQLDAGQKKFGIVDCKECGLHYNTNVPEDELVHEKHHQEMLQIPRFKGWANENAIQINGLDESSRIVRLEPGHKNMDSHYVTEILHNMTSELGVLLNDHQKYHIYLAVYAGKIVGVCAAEDSVMATKTESVSQVRVGVQRLFVRPAFRRKGIAKAILKTIMLTHFKGQMLETDDIAFSSPTDDGIKFVQSITKRDVFYVY